MNSDSAANACPKPMVGAALGAMALTGIRCRTSLRRQRGLARPLLLGGIALLLGVLVWLQYSDSGPPVAGAVVKRSATATLPRPAESATPRPVPGAASTSTAGATPEGAILELLPRRKLDAQEREAFAAHRWLPPPPPPVAPAPPPKPMAPPLPYRFVGKSKTEAGWSVFLARGEQTHIAIANTTLEGTYRIAAIQPPVLKLLYLPLNQEQTLDIGPETQ